MSMISTAPLIRPTISRRGAQQFRLGTLSSLCGALLLFLERKRQRRTLGELAEDPHLLADIGLTREQALREAGKPIWQ